MQNYGNFQTFYAMAVKILLIRDHFSNLELKMVRSVSPVPRAFEIGAIFGRAIYVLVV